MAHDRQVPPSLDGSETPKYSHEYRALIRQVLNNLLETYKGELTYDLQEIWKDALQDLSPQVIRLGLALTLRKHLDFMPTPAQFRQYAEDAGANLRGAFSKPVEEIRRRNVRDEVAEIAQEIFPGYAGLDPHKQAHLIEKITRQAAAIRYLRNGVFPKWLANFEDLEELRKKWANAGA